MRLVPELTFMAAKIVILWTATQHRRVRDTDVSDERAEYLSQSVRLKFYVEYDGSGFLRNVLNFLLVYSASKHNRMIVVQTSLLIFCL